MRKRRMKLLEEEERKMISIAITVVAALSIIIVTISYVIVVAIQTNHKMENGDHKLFTISCLMSQYDLPKLTLNIFCIFQISAKKTFLTLGV